MARDSTGRKGVERALKQALVRVEECRATMEAMLECAPTGIVVADAPDGHIGAASRSALELSGKPRDQLEGIPAPLHAQRWQIYRADRVTPAAANDLPLTRAVRRGEIVRDEEWAIERADGSRVAVLCTAVPIRDPAGAVIGGVVAWQDIPARKALTPAVRENERERALAVAVDETQHERAEVRTVEADEQRVRHNRRLQRLVAQLSQSEQRERRRFAYLLQDDVQQILAAVKIQLWVLDGMDTAAVSQAVQRLSSDLDEAIRSARALSDDLSPRILHDGVLADALYWLAGRKNENQDLTLHVDADPAAEPASEDMKVLLFQATRELLRNVVRHAGVDEASIALRQDARTGLCLSVSDRGCGFDPAEVESRVDAPFGLFGIRERLAIAGGEMRIDSSPAGGTTVWLFAPVGNREPD
ncbi:MAG: ATP-binding protein [Halofilum sp. (in: g-proteobacteria)]